MICAGCGVGLSEHISVQEEIHPGCYCRNFGCAGGVTCPAYPGEFSEILYTKEEGGPLWKLRVHSVYLPNGKIWDSHFKDFRPEPADGPSKGWDGEITIVQPDAD